MIPLVNPKMISLAQFQAIQTKPMKSYEKKIHFKIQNLMIIKQQLEKKDLRSVEFDSFLFSEKEIFQYINLNTLYMKNGQWLLLVASNKYFQFLHFLFLALQTM